MFENLPDESNKIEYKIELPEDHIKWLKTIVSFSNTAGGQFILGVEDNTKRVIGITGSRSTLESQIADIIYSNIEPTPLIDISFKNIDNKDILIIHVSRGQETPYYIKSQGITDGTYQRFGSTDRVATEAQLNELKFNSKRLHFSNSIYEASDPQSSLLSEEDVGDFLQVINKKNIIKEITSNKLVEWELITKRFDEHHATNGYMLLTSNPFSYAYIKLGVFDGIDKAKMLHEESFTGSIIEQYNHATKRINEILTKGYDFTSVRRKEYAIPEVVTREIVANAVIHRNYIEEHPIRIEIYSDRISIVSPGSLYDGLQLEDITQGVSKLRNRNIAEIFHSIGYIEKWGSGIQRSNQVLLEHGLKELEIDTESIHMVTVTIYFEQSKQIEATGIPLAEDVVSYYIKQQNSFKRRDLQEDFKITERQARTIIEKLVEEKVIEKVGLGPSTHYVISKN